MREYFFDTRQGIGFLSFCSFFQIGFCDLTLKISEFWHQPCISVFKDKGALLVICFSTVILINFCIF